MSTRPVDQAVRDRVVAETLSPKLVEAGAGTGKTRLLVDRLLAGLRRDHYRLDRVAGITFTRLAAGEMENRLRAEIHQAIDRESAEEQRRLLIQARGTLPSAQISTIHSFCHQILRDHPLEAGLDPDFQGVDENRQRSELEAQWEEWLERRLQNETTNDPLGEMLAWGGSLEEIRTMALDLAENPDADPPPCPEDGIEDGRLWNEISQTWEELFSMAQNNLLPGKSDKLIDQLRDQQTLMERLEALAPDLRTRWLLARLEPDGVKFPALKGKKGQKPNFRGGFSLDDFRRGLKMWRDQMIPALLHRRFAPLATGVIQALGEFRAWARARRKERGRINNTDLLFETAVLLETDAGVARNIRRRLQALFVDEYQDTDPLQARIVRALTKDDEGPVLFLVGDPKQSIYRFRRADVGTFLQEVKRFEDREGALRIQVNFRSSPLLLDRLNEVLAEVFDPQNWGEGKQASWQPLWASPEAVTPPGPAMVLIPLEENAEGEDADQRRERAARAIAQSLKQAAAEGTPWRDMAILAPYMTNPGILEDVLEEEAIPYRMEKSRGYFQRPEVAEIGQVLTAVADPWDEVSGLAALRGGLFGFSDAELTRHRLAGGAFCAACCHKKGEPEIVAGLETLARWHEESQSIPAPALLEKILDETRFFHLLPRFPGGLRMAGNVSKLLDQATEQWESGALGLTELAAWLRTQIAGEGDREAERGTAQEEDRVGVMSIHAAKGLERDVIALFDIQNQGNPQKKKTVVDRDLGRMEVCFRVGGGALRTSGFERAEAEEAEFARAEKARWLYVALTRARKRVIVPFPKTTSKKEQNSLLAQLRLSGTWVRWSEQAKGPVPDAEGVVVVQEGELTAGQPPGVTKEKPEEGTSDASGLQGWMEERQALLRAADRRVVITPSALHDESVPSPSLPPHPRGAAIGSAVHQAMEWVVAGVAGAPSALAARAAQKETLSEEDEGRVIGMVERACEMGMIRRARQSPRVFTELPIVWMAPLGQWPPGPAGMLRRHLEQARRPGPSPEEPVVVEGIADLVIEDEGGLILADYKTDPWAVEEDLEVLAGRYRPQIELYAAALEGITGRPVVERRLLFLGGPRPLDLPV